MAIEKLVLILATDIQNGNREYRDQDVGLPESLENLLEERYLLQSRELLFRRTHTKVLDGFLDAKEVAAHDGASFILRACRHKSAIHGESDYPLDIGRVGVDSNDDCAGIIATSGPKPVLCAVYVTVCNFSPFHNYYLSLLALRDLFLVWAAGYWAYDPELYG